MRLQRRLTVTLSLSVALPLAALAAAGCSSVMPLDPNNQMPSDCNGLPIPLIACATGETVPVCTLDPAGRPRWLITCPGQQDAGLMTGAAGAGGDGGTGGRGGGGGGGAAGAGPVACTSTSSCAQGEVCTTEDGDCKSPPGCGPNLACPAVCYGECRPGRAGGACTNDDDCHLEADYCTGCDCRSLATGETVPRCPGPGVACFADPCDRLTARCVNGRCGAR
jgi:hypothetical protein